MPVTARLSRSIPREGDYKDWNRFAHPEVAMGNGASNARRHLATPKGCDQLLSFAATRRSGALVSVIAWLAPWQNNTIS
jgi:hypothetical protein